VIEQGQLPFIVVLDFEGWGGWGGMVWSQCQRQQKACSSFLFFFHGVDVWVTEGSSVPSELYNSLQFLPPAKYKAIETIT
jgi:hypothetical protein